MQQQRENRNEEINQNANPQRSGEETPGVQETSSGEQDNQQQKEEWQRGISQGSHEKKNAGNPSEPEGTSSIPLDKNDTMGNP